MRTKHSLCLALPRPLRVVRGKDASLVCHLIQEDLSPTGNCINEETWRDSKKKRARSEARSYNSTRLSIFVPSPAPLPPIPCTKVHPWRGNFFAIG